MWLAARRMDRALAGHVLVSSDFRVPALATVDLAGTAVTEVVPRGKHLLTRLSNGLTLHTHFRMDGSWHLYAPGDRWKGPDFQVRAVLATATTVAVGFRLPVVELVPTDQEADVVGHLGPDVLADDFDQAEAVRRLGAVPQRAIGMALLDQRNLAGLGNLYRLEALFLTGVTPWTPVSEVDLDRLVTRSVRLIRANREHPEQSTTGSLRPGEQHWVFERAGRPCRRCGQRVLRADQGEGTYTRVTYWCGHCQQGVTGP
ncbi:MAG: DNA-(apurinic or apyrimidinic site) lyase [Frankiales bacterium]|nr:DNA-(apurinic or apyrimidinic site) lyase [Frankiales bacterium]